MKNYLTLNRFSLLYDHYAFIDVPAYYADQIFIRIRLRFVSERSIGIRISHMLSSSAKSGSEIVIVSFPHCQT